MEPGEVRRAILDDHRVLRELLVELDQLSRRVLGGEADLEEEIHRVGERFLERFLHPGSYPRQVVGFSLSAGCAI